MVIILPQGYHYQHSFEQNGYITGREDKGICWRRAITAAGSCRGDFICSLTAVSVPTSIYIKIQVK
jgi:hypothetical protein